MSNKNIQKVSIRFFNDREVRAVLGRDTIQMSFRLENQQLTMKEITLAEKVDSDLVKRAKVEATNIATRSPGAGDVTWQWR